MPVCLAAVHDDSNLPLLPPSVTPYRAATSTWFQNYSSKISPTRVRQDAGRDCQKAQSVIKLFGPHEPNCDSLPLWKVGFGWQKANSIPTLRGLPEAEELVKASLTARNRFSSATATLNIDRTLQAHWTALPDPSTSISFQK